MNKEEIQSRGQNAGITCDSIKAEIDATYEQYSTLMDDETIFATVLNRLASKLARDLGIEGTRTAEIFREILQHLKLTLMNADMTLGGFTPLSPYTGATIKQYFDEHGIKVVSSSEEQKANPNSITSEQYQALGVLIENINYVQYRRINPEQSYTL